MAQRGYPGIHAGMPTAQDLRSAIVVNGAPEIKSLPEAALEPTWFWMWTAFILWERACSRLRFHIQHGYRLIRRHREQARSHSGFCVRLWILGDTKHLWERACSR
ncbi:hypothetical protein PHLH4_56280 [Pseudomonas sp. St316]|nr:hypothetical protein PHLH4_56280 [Pseudomonas sp. St316]